MLSRLSPIGSRAASAQRSRRSQLGISLLELVVTLGLASAFFGMAVMNMRKLEDPLQSGAAQLSSFMKQVRAEAISHTLAYTVVPLSTGRIGTRYASKCSDTTTTTDSRVSLHLPTGAYLSGTGWTLCFNSRGLPDANLEIELKDVGGQTKIVEVMLGGAVRIK